MKLRANRSELADAVTMAASVAPTRSPLKDILKCILMEVHSDYALLSATDSEIGVRCSITQIEVDDTGSVMVAADKLGQIVRESGDEILSIESAGDDCHIRGADSHFQIRTRPVEEFPPIPQVEDEFDFEINAADLRRVSDWTVFAAARENTRYAINGVLWERSGERLTLVSTDGRRLSQAVHVLEESGEDRSIIVPTKAMQVVSRVLTNSEGSVGVKMTPNQILLKSPRATLSSSLLEGHFPKYEDVIPSDCDKHVEFDTQELLSAVRRAALLSNEESKGIKLLFSSGTLTLSSRTPEQGEAVVSVPINYTGDEVEIGFNPVFLTDVLRVAFTDRVVFEFAEANRPGVFRCGDGFLYVVMPVNLS